MFIHTFLFVFLAEMADKTQLMMMAMTNRYRLRSVISGMMVGVIIISGFSTLAGDFIGDIIPMWVVKWGAAFMFLGFGFMNLRASQKEEEHKLFKIRIPLVAIALAFLSAELGDKTQLATVALAADHMQEHLSIFLGASTGLIMANILGIAFGRLIFSHLKEDTVKVISSFIFFLFGSITIFEIIPGTPILCIAYSFLIIFIAYQIFTHTRRQQA